MTTTIQSSLSGSVLLLIAALTGCGGGGGAITGDGANNGDSDNNGENSVAELSLTPNSCINHRRRSRGTSPHIVRNPSAKRKTLRCAFRYPAHCHRARIASMSERRYQQASAASLLPSKLIMAFATVQVYTLQPHGRIVSARKAVPVSLSMTRQARANNQKQTSACSIPTVPGNDRTSRLPNSIVRRSKRRHHCLLPPLGYGDCRR